MAMSNNQMVKPLVFMGDIRGHPLLLIKLKDTIKWCDLFVAVFTARQKPGRQIHQRPRGRDTTAWSAKLGNSRVHRSLKIEGQKMNLDLCWFLCRRSSTELMFSYEVCQNSPRSDIEPWPTSPCRQWLYWHSLASNLGMAVIIQIHWFPKALSRLETVHAECAVQCGSAFLIWMWQSQYT